jgi:shikimate kinase
MEGEAATPLEIKKLVEPAMAKLCSEHKLARQLPYIGAWPIEKVIVDVFTGQSKPPQTSASRHCVLLIGPSCVGKTTLGQALASRLGYVQMEMSSFAWQRFKNRKNFHGSLQDYMEEVVWTENDKAIIAKDLLESQPDLENVVICGPRTVEEIELLLEQHWNCKALYLFANAHVQYSRYCLQQLRPDRFSIS